jgi:hypothetical protein
MGLRPEEIRVRPPTRRAGTVLLSIAALAVITGATPATAATPPVKIVKVAYDSPGTDNGGNVSLNAEQVVIKNVSARAQTLTGWTLRDKQNHVYKFPTFQLAAGQSVTVHTGKGTATQQHRYFNAAWYVWNNTGDQAILRNAAGATIHTCAWSAVGTGTKTC